MIFDILKVAGGFVAGASAGRVVTDVIARCTNQAVDRHILENVVFRVGTIVIAGAVSAAVSRYVHREICELEKLMYKDSNDEYVDMFVQNGWTIVSSVNGITSLRKGNASISLTYTNASDKNTK